MTWKSLISRSAATTSVVGALALAVGADSWDAVNNWVGFFLAWLSSL